MKLNWFILFISIFMLNLTGSAQSGDQQNKLYEKLNLADAKVDSFRAFQLDSALHYQEVVLTTSFALNDSLKIGSAHHKKGKILQNAGKPDKALQSYQNALTIRTEMGDSARMGSSYEAIAKLYKSFGDTAGAIENFHRSLAIKSKLGIPKYLGPLYNAIGSYYSDLTHFDSAQFYYDKSLEIYELLNDEVRIAKVQNNLGTVFYNQGDYEHAIKLYHAVLDIYLKFEYQVGQAETYNNLGACFEKTGAYQRAIVAYEHSALLFIESDYKEHLEQLYVSISDVYLKLGNDHLAYKNLKTAQAFRDSMVSIDLQKAIEELKTKYQNERLESLLAVKDAKAESRESERQQERLKLYLLIGACLLSIGILIFFYLSQNQKKKFLEQSVLLKNQEIDKLLERQEIKSYSDRLQGQDKERKRIAADLHDRLGSILSTVKLHFETVEERLDLAQQENASHYQKATALLDNAVEEVRKISHSLSTGVLSKFGLKAALHELKETIDTTGKLRVELYLEGLDDRYDQNIEIETYRIIQELISNVLKHAHASEIILQMNVVEKQINLTFEDNGIGFDPDTKGAGIGIQNMKTRVQNLNGQLQIDSRKGHGTTVIIDIPLDA